MVNPIDRTVYILFSTRWASCTVLFSSYLGVLICYRIKHQKSLFVKERGQFLLSTMDYHRPHCATKTFGHGKHYLPYYSYTSTWYWVLYTIITSYNGYDTIMTRLPLWPRQKCLIDIDIQFSKSSLVTLTYDSNIYRDYVILAKTDDDVTLSKIDNDVVRLEVVKNRQEHHIT